VAGETAVDVAKELAPLEKRLAELRTEIYKNLTPMQRVQVARHPKATVHARLPEHGVHGLRRAARRPAVPRRSRPGGRLGAARRHERHGDRAPEGPRHQGESYRNFGMAHPEGYRKALRLMHLAEQFRAPVITLVDTPGAYPGLGAEERGQAEAIARNLVEMATLRTPDHYRRHRRGRLGRRARRRTRRPGVDVRELRVLRHLPRGLRRILWKDASQRERAAEALKITAKTCWSSGSSMRSSPSRRVERTPIRRPPPRRWATRLRRHVRQLRKVRIEKLLKRREEKYLSMGALSEK